MSFAAYEQGLPPGRDGVAAERAHAKAADREAERRAIGCEVVILGPGALGRSIGRTLEAGGARVAFVGRGGEAWGSLPLERDASGRVSWPDRANPETPRLSLVTVKAYDTHAAADLAASILAHGTVVSLQNGLGNVEALVERTGRPLETFAGATTHAARRLPSGEVETISLGETVIAPWLWSGVTASGMLTEQAAQTLSRFGLPTSGSMHARRLLWRKLAVSCGINGLTAVERCTNGDLLSRPTALRRAIEAAAEALAVGRACGIDLGDLDAEALVRDVCERTAGNRSSMLQDVEARRRTETREIHGAVVRAACENGGLRAGVNQALEREIASLEAKT